MTARKKFTGPWLTLAFRPPHGYLWEPQASKGELDACYADGDCLAEHYPETVDAGRVRVHVSFVRRAGYERMRRVKDRLELCNPYAFDDGTVVGLTHGMAEGIRTHGMAEGIGWDDSDIHETPKTIWDYEMPKTIWICWEVEDAPVQEAD